MTDARDGLLAIDKPAGPTSHDVVAWVRAATGVVRVGHTGTLDPDATGLLLLVLGRATRLARFVPDAPKTYHGTFALCVTTTTDDLSGDVVRTFDGPPPDPEAVRSAAAGLVGRQMQVPPAFSARRVSGTRLYRAARRGERLDAPPAEVFVMRLDVSKTEAPDRFAYEMVVSSGTYVRAIVRDIGEALGCGAAVASIRRTAIGPFGVEAAIRLPAEKAARREAVFTHLIPLDAMPLALPSLALEADADAVRFASGAIVPAQLPGSVDPVLAAVRDRLGRLLGVGEWIGTTIKPRVVVPERP